MKKRMKALAALLCVTAMVTGCGSGKALPRRMNPKKKNQKLPLVFPVKEILLTLVQDLAIPGRLCIPIW